MKNNLNKLQIFEDKMSGLSYGEIGIKHGIARSSVQYIIETFKLIKKKRRLKEKLDKNDKRKWKTKLDHNFKKSENSSSLSIIKELNLNISKSTFCRTMKCLKYNYKNLPNKFHLTYRMRQNRITAARKFLTSQIKWDNVVFSDEKLFHLHGSNSYYSWINSNQSPQRLRKVIRSSGIMVWAMILPNGLLSYEIMKGKQKATYYVRILESRGLPIMKLNMKDEIIFQQDNCPIHMSRFAGEFFKKS